MQPSYAHMEMLIDASWQDRVPRMPMVGFVLGTGLSLLLWGAIGWSVWALVA